MARRGLGSYGNGEKVTIAARLPLSRELLDVIDGRVLEVTSMRSAIIGVIVPYLTSGWDLARIGSL